MAAHTTLLVLLLSVLCSGSDAIRRYYFEGTTSDHHFLCHCRNGAQCVEPQGSNSGTCPNGCDNQTVAWAPWYGPGCQIGNVAYKKSAWQLRTNNALTVANKANDGNQETTGNNNYAYIYHLNTYEYPWWIVDLWTLHVIYNITIVIPESNYAHQIIVRTSQQQGFSSVTCTYTGRGFINNILTVNCQQVLGRFVEVGRTTRSEFALAEVAVWGYEYHSCTDEHQGGYYFGPGCLQNCHCRTQCNQITGACEGGCRTGYTGNTCQMCADGYCDPCEHGRYGNQCTSYCNCRDSEEQCDRVSGRCTSGCKQGAGGDDCQECEDGYWGPQCTLCGCLDAHEVCDQRNGSCTSGCADWHAGVGCSYLLPRLPRNAAPKVLLMEGIRVAVEFPQIICNGSASCEVVSYELELATLPHRIWEPLNMTYKHINHQQFHLSHLQLPEYKTYYVIRAVPYSNLHRDSPGEPSVELHIYTDCPSGFIGQTCSINRDVVIYCTVAGLVLCIILAIVAWRVYKKSRNCVSRNGRRNERMMPALPSRNERDEKEQAEGGVKLVDEMKVHFKVPMKLPAEKEDDQNQEEQVEDATEELYEELEEQTREQSAKVPATSRYAPMQSQVALLPPVLPKLPKAKPHQQNQQDADEYEQEDRQLTSYQNF